MMLAPDHRKREAASRTGLDLTIFHPVHAILGCLGRSVLFAKCHQPPTRTRPSLHPRAAGMGGRRAGHDCPGWLLPNSISGKPNKAVCIDRSEE